VRAENVVSRHFLKFRGKMVQKSVKTEPATDDAQSGGRGKDRRQQREQTSVRQARQAAPRVVGDQ